MTSTKKGTKDDVPVPETDPYLALALVTYKMTCHPDPVSLENPQYVVTVGLWPSFLLINKVPWTDIMNHYGVAGPLLEAFRLALAREFKAQVTTHAPLMEHILEIFKRVADIVIHHTVVRGPEELIRRLKLTMEDADTYMNSLIAARMEAEAGVEAGQIIREAKVYDPSRYPPSLHAFLAKAQKSAHGPKREGKRIKGGGGTGTPGTCEWCKQAIKGDFASHNLVCPARKLAKGTPTKSGKPKAKKPKGKGT